MKLSTTVSQVGEPVPARRSFASTLAASIAGPIVWATLVASSTGCFLFLASSSGSPVNEVVTYSIGFSVAAAVSGVAVLAFRGRLRLALAAGLPTTILCVLVAWVLWAHAASIIDGGGYARLGRSGDIFAREYMSGCLIVGAAPGAALGLIVGCIVATLAFFAARSKTWAFLILVALIMTAATRWPLGQAVSYATTLGFELSSSAYYSHKSVRYTADSIRGGGEGAAIGAVVGSLIAAVASIERKQSKARCR